MRHIRCLPSPRSSPTVSMLLLEVSFIPGRGLARLAYRLCRTRWSPTRMPVPFDSSRCPVAPPSGVGQSGHIP